MKYVIWALPNGTQLPMIKPDDGPMQMLPKAAAGALGCSYDALRQQMHEHKHSLSYLTVRNSHTTESDNCAGNSGANCVRNSHAIEFLKENKDVFGLSRVRGDMRLLTDGDFLYLAAHINTNQARGIHQGYINFVIEQTRADTVSREEHQALQRYYESLAERFEALEQKVQAADPFVSRSASLAGSLLNAQRGTKGIRGLN